MSSAPLAAGADASSLDPPKKTKKIHGIQLIFVMINELCKHISVSESRIGGQGTRFLVSEVRWFSL